METDRRYPVKVINPGDVFLDERGIGWMLNVGCEGVADLSKLFVCNVRLSYRGLGSCVGRHLIRDDELASLESR